MQSVSLEKASHTKELRPEGDPHLSRMAAISAWRRARGGIGGQRIDEFGKTP